MASPLVGDTVTFVGRSGSTPYVPATTGVLLRVDREDTLGPWQATIAPLDAPDKEMRIRYDALIALPVTSNQPGANDGWASVTNPPAVHLLRCVDESAAEWVWTEVQRTGGEGAQYGRNLLFRVDRPSSYAVNAIAEYALGKGYAIHDETLALLDRYQES